MRPRVISSLQTIIIVLVITVSSSYAQPKIPKENIPFNIDSEVRKQIEALYSSDAVQRGYAAYKLGNLKDKAVPAIPFLIEMLGQGPTLEWVPSGVPLGFPGGIGTAPGEEAEKALTKIGQPAVDSLIATLKLTDRGSYVQFQAARSLGVIRDSRAVEPLSHALTNKDSHWSVRSEAAKALGRIKDPAAVPPLIRALKDPFYNAQIEAAHALGEIADVRAVEPLIALLNDERKNVSLLNEEQTNVRLRAQRSRNLRNVTARALGKIKDPRPVELLIAALMDMDEHWIVRAGAAAALGETKHPLAVESLIKVLRNKNERTFITMEAKTALENITGEKFGKNPSWQEWWDKNRARYQVPPVDQ